MSSRKDAPGIPPPIEILVVEDNRGDAILLKKFLEGVATLNHVHIVTDGQEAMDYLSRKGPYQGAPRPDLIFLDLNLPRKDGREVLREIKRDPDLQEIPVLVLTTSSWDQDVTEAYEDHANFYIVKPADLDLFLGSMRYVENVWLKTLVHRES